MPSTTVAAGTTLDVSAIGSCTDPPGDVPAVTFDLVNDMTLSYPDVYGDYAGSSRTAHIVIPASTPPGAYQLTGYCTHSRSITTWYPTVPITVVAQN